MALVAATPLASAARTTSGAGTGLSVLRFVNVLKGQLGLLLAVTAVSGTAPTLDVAVEWSANGTTFYPAAPPDAFPQVTAVGGMAKLFDIKAPFWRPVWTIGGTTPSFTFTITSLSY